MIVRNPVYDVMKGIGIIAMVIGHCTIPEMLFKFIFIWHMPLFFFISGYFFHEKKHSDMLISTFKTLIIPYFITAVLIVLLSLIKSYYCYNIFYDYYIIGTLTGSGSPNNPYYMGGNYCIGAIWFLLALAWCRIIYNLIYHYICTTSLRIITIFLLSYVASLIGRKVYIPTDLTQGVAAMSFFLIGNLCRESLFMDTLTQYKRMTLTISLILLTLGLFMRPMGIVDNNYQFWPLNVLAGMGGVFVVYLISQTLVKYLNAKQLSYMGRISLIILSVHLIDINIGIIDFLWGIIFEYLSIIPSLYNPRIVSLSSVLLHVIFAIAFSYIVSKNAIVRKLYNLK